MKQKLKKMHYNEMKKCDNNLIKAFSKGPRFKKFIIQRKYIEKNNFIWIEK